LHNPSQEVGDVREVQGAQRTRRWWNGRTENIGINKCETEKKKGRRGESRESLRNLGGEKDYASL